MKIAFFMDDLAKIKTQKDTSFTLMLGAKELGFDVLYFQDKDLFVKDATAYANLSYLELSDKQQNYYKIKKQEILNLDNLDFILIRKDPPVDQNYIYCMQILKLANTKLINSPDAICNFNEKLFSNYFKNFIPKTLITKTKEELIEFAKKHQETIIKPLDGMGGDGIFKLHQNEANLNVILETVTNSFKNFVMIQEFLKEIKSGDKRIIVLNGKAIDFVYARFPKGGEVRANIAAGGFGQVKEITNIQRNIANEVGKILYEKNIFFAGIDMIGNKITEINITSPTCLREIENETGQKIARNFIKSLV